MKTLITTLLLVSLLSCQSTQKGITLETFTDFPPEIDGCSCYFSSNQSEFDKGIFMYMDDYMDLAFVKFGGELITFNRVTNSQRDEEVSEWVYEDYKLKMEWTKQGEIDERVQFSGNLKLIKNGVTLVNHSNLVGECGC